MKKLIILIILLFTWPCLSEAAIHYVEKNGSQTSPFDTLAKAANTIQHVFDNIDLAPSDRVRVCAATVGGSATYAEKVIPGANDDGDATGNVVLEGRSGDTITIDGTDYAVRSGGADYMTFKNLTLTSVTSYAIYFSGGHDYVFEDITATIGITSHGAVFSGVTGGLALTRCDFSGVGGGGVYINATCNMANVTATDVICDTTGSNGFLAAAGVNFTFTDCSFDGNDVNGLKIDDVSGTIDIANCSFDNNATRLDGAGTAIKAPVTAYGDVTITTSTFDGNKPYGLDIGHCAAGGCGGIDIQTSTFNDSYCTGLLIEDPANGANVIVVAGNKFDGNCDGCYDLPSRGAGLWLDNAVATTVYKNKFKNTEYVGEVHGRGLIISSDAVASNVTAYSNVFIDNYIGIDVHALGGTNITAANLCNNTIANSEYASIKIHSAGAETIAMTMKNNISYNPGTMHIQQTSVGGTEDYSHNDYYPEANDFWTFGADTDNDTVAEWQAASSEDANAINTDPDFVNNTIDLHLLASSPCIDAADLTAIVTTDIDGRIRPIGSAYDIGADEYSPVRGPHSLGFGLTLN